MEINEEKLRKLVSKTRYTAEQIKDLHFKYCKARSVKSRGKAINDFNKNNLSSQNDAIIILRELGVLIPPKDIYMRLPTQEALELLNKDKKEFRKTVVYSAAFLAVVAIMSSILWVVYEIKPQREIVNLHRTLEGKIHEGDFSFIDSRLVDGFVGKKGVLKRSSMRLLNAALECLYNDYCGDDSHAASARVVQKSGYSNSRIQNLAFSIAEPEIEAFKINQRLIKYGLSDYESEEQYLESRLCEAVRRSATPNMKQLISLADFDIGYTVCLKNTSCPMSLRRLSGSQYGREVEGQIRCYEEYGIIEGRSMCSRYDDRIQQIKEMNSLLDQYNKYPAGRCTIVPNR